MLSDRRRNHASRIQKQMRLESLENRMMLASDLAWPAPESYPIDGLEPWDVDAGDLNGDGNLDLAVAQFGFFHPAGDISVLMGRGDGTFEPAVRYRNLPKGVFVEVEDLNGDQFPDVVMGGIGFPADVPGGIGCAPLCVSVLLNNGDGSLSSEATHYALEGFAS